MEERPKGEESIAAMSLKEIVEELYILLVMTSYPTRGIRDTLDAFAHNLNDWEFARLARMCQELHWRRILLANNMPQDTPWPC